MKEFAVLSACMKYQREQLSPFVKSWKNNVPDADLVMFVDQITPETTAWLLEEGVQLVPASFCKFQAGAERRRYLRHQALEGATSIFLFLIGLFSKKSNPQTARIRQAMLDVNSSRFNDYLNFLRLFGSRYSSVFLADCRDLIFQDTPFPSQGLHTFEERDTIGNSRMARLWFEWTYGRSFWRRLSKHAFLCSGTILGDTASILQLLALMVRECCNQQANHGEDQIVLNYIIHHLQLACTTHSCGTGGVITLHSAQLEDLDIVDGKLCDLNGAVIPVVHQYDRVPGLAEQLAALRNCREA